MKGRWILIFALLFTVLGWLGSPLLALYPRWIHSKLSNECTQTEGSGAQLTVTPAGELPQSAENCRNLISQLGQSGDIFGAATSLFSGLALFAVAFALYADLAHRRRERKPLVVCNIDDNTLAFDKPTIDANPKSFYFVGRMSVNSITETAINAAVIPTLIIDQHRFPLETLIIQVPLEAGKSQPVELSDILDRQAIDHLCTHHQFLSEFQLELKTTYSNLDGETFGSEVKYKVTLRFPDNVSRVMSMRHSGQGLDGAWDDRAPVPLVCTLVPGSWQFRSKK